MSFSKPCALALVFGSLVVNVTCRQPLPVGEKSWRQAREAAVRKELPLNSQASFSGLRFFPYDSAYRMRVMIEPITSSQGLRMAASNGEVRPAHRIGRVKLRLPRGPATLTLYRLDDMAAQAPDHLFLPFRDAGAGTSTYGAGRYVEVDRLAGGVIEIDFNRAYNPDCVYGITGSCPITPDENTLPFLVEAGEMMPAHH